MEGELGVMLEIQSCMSHKDEKLQPRGIKRLADLKLVPQFNHHCVFFWRH